MKRNLMKSLIKWKDIPDKKPLVLSGIKGAGKTYLALDYAKSFYEGNIYINFETNASISAAFDQNEHIDKPLNFFEFICLYYEIPSGLLSNILIILDEMQCSSSAYLSFIKSIDDFDNISCMLITSEANSYSEQACRFFYKLKLYPFEFDEFLAASGYEWYVEIITAHSNKNRKIPDIVHKELLALFEDYLSIGGMPAAINEYLNTESSENIGQIHQNIFNCIQMYNISKYSESHSLKMKQVYETLEVQIIKEHPKFQYRPIRRGATYAMYKDAIMDLKLSGQLLMCNKLTQINSNLRPEKPVEYNEASFKLYYFDTGILNYIMSRNYNLAVLDEGKKKKILMSNYVAQCLSTKGYHAYFWESHSGARIDFIFENNDGAIPIDVRVSEVKRSKSLSVFKNEYEFPYSIKLVSKNFDIDGCQRSVPYYALFSLF